MALSPSLMAQLAARGIIPPQGGAPFGSAFGDAGLTLPDPNAAPPPAPAAATVAAPAPAPAGPAGAVDDRNAQALAAMSAMSPDQRQAAIQQGAQGFQQALGGIEAPRVAASGQAPGATAPQRVEGVFAPQGGGAGGAGLNLPPQMVGGGGAFPGGWVSTVSPETRKQLEAAAKAKMEAANLGQMADMSNADMQAQAAQGVADATAGQADEMRAAEANRAKALDDQMAEYRALRQQAAQGQIKPPQVGLMGAIGVALSAAGSSLTHTQNTALEVINKRIDNEIAAQRANIENGWKSADAAGNELQMMRQRFGDDRLAEAALRAKKIEEAKTVGDVMVARAQSPIMAAKWAAVKAGLGEDQAKLHGSMERQVPGGAGGPNDEIKQLAKELYKNGSVRDPQEALNAAAYLVSRGQYGANQSRVMAGGKVSPRIAMRQADVEDADRAAQRLQNLLRSGSSLSMAQREQAKADAALLRQHGFTTVPENPLEVLSSSGARGAGLDEVRRQIADQRNSLSKFGASSGGGGDEREAEGDMDEGITPAGGR